MTDSSGAVVPGVEITIVHKDTNITRVVLTDDRGNYLADKLLAGRYDLTAELVGFKRDLVVGIELQSSQRARIDFLLWPGEIEDSVTVTDQSVTLDTATADRSTTLDEKQITDLPINGRNLTVLSELTTGAVGVRYSTDTRFARDGGGLPAINGLRPDQSNTQLFDGSNNQELIDQKAVVKPTPETIREFKIITNSVSAEYSKVGGMVVSAVSKSGTNEFHGQVWEYLRNERFNANGFFANRSKLGKLPFSEHNFGAAIGGPIVKNRTFFFGSFEGFRTNFSVPGVMDVPSAAERQGDFSKGDGPWGQRAVYDPFNVQDGQRVPFPDNKIPANRIHPVSKKIMDMVPFPSANQNGFPNYSYRHGTERSVNKFSGRVDHNFANDSQIFGRFTYSTDPTITHGAPGSCSPCPQGVFGSFVGRGRVGVPGMAEGVYQTKNLQDNGWQTSGGWVKPIGSSIVNEINASGWFFWGGGKSLDDVNWVEKFGYDIADQVKAEGPDGERGPAGLPAINISGYGSIAGATAGHQTSRGMNVKETLSWKKGSHYLKFGFEHLRYYDSKTRWVPEGSASNTFDGFVTGQITRNPAGNVTGSTQGQPFADFLLGTSSAVTANILGGGGFGTGFIGGVDVMSSYSMFVNDDWRVTPDVTLNLGLRWEIPLPATWIFDKTNCFIDVTGGRNNPIQVVPKGFPLNSPFVTGGDHSVLVIPHRERSERTCVDPHYKDFAPRFGVAWRMFGTNQTVLRFGTGISFDNVVGGFLAPQGSLGHYVGAVTDRHTRGTVPTNFIGQYRNLPTLAARKIHPLPYSFAGDDSQSGQVYSYNLSIQHEVRRGTKLEVAYVGNQGRHLRTYRIFNVAMPEGQEMFLNTGERLIATGTQEQRRPYPLVGPNIHTNFDGSTNYNSLQMKLEQRFQNGLAFTTGYTWGSTFYLNSQGLYFSGAQSEFRRHELKGKPRWDRAQAYYATLVWELPFFKTASGFRRGLLGGWEVTGVATLATGAPYGVIIGSDLNDIGGRRVLLPNRSCDGNLPESERTVTRYYDVGCFSVPARGQFGNSAMLPLRGDGIAMTDLGLHKSFSLGEEREFDFRVEMFNALNHTIFDTPGGNVGQDSIDGRSAGTVNGAAASRQIQLSFRFSF